MKIGSGNVIKVKYTLDQPMGKVRVDFKEAIKITGIKVTGGDITTDLTSKSEDTLINELAKFKITLAKKDNDKIVEVTSNEKVTEERIEKYGDHITVTIENSKGEKTTFTINLTEAK